MDRELWQLSGGELLAELDAAEARLRRAYARSVAVIGEINSRGLAGELGAASVRQLLRWRLHLSDRDAAIRIAAGELPVATANSDGTVDFEDLPDGGPPPLPPPPTTTTDAAAPQ